MNKSYIAWIVCLVLLVVSAVMASSILFPLPDLPVRLDAELTVRGDAMSEGVDFNRGDRVVAAGGQQTSSLEQLLDVLAVKKAGSVDVKFVRPNHRFTVQLTDGQDSEALPAGVEANDVLTSIDGRALPGPVQLEGLRSIIASRPQSLLGFQRQNAIFSGPLQTDHPLRRFSFLGVFLLAFAIVLMLGLRRSRELPWRFAAGVAFETLALAWVAVLLLDYQWAIADRALGAACMFGLVYTRPFAVLAWSSLRSAGGAWVGFVIATVSIVALYTLFQVGKISLEQGLQGAGIFAVLYLGYELVLTHVDPLRSGLGDRVGYLTGVLALVAVAAASAFFADSDAFMELRWLWFVIVMLTLVWFGDVMYTVRGPTATGLSSVSTSESRAALIAEYFEELAEPLEGLRPTFGVMVGNDCVEIKSKNGKLLVDRANRALSDALSILTEEQVQIPPVVASEHPMVGIAKTMSIGVAAEVSPPSAAVQFDDLKLVFVAYRGRKAEVMVTAEAVDIARLSMNERVWSAAVLETLELLSKGSSESAALETLRKELQQAEALTHRLQSELDSSAQRSDLLQKDRIELGAFISFFAEQSRQPLADAFADIETVLEPQLVESIDYLLEDDAPLVIGGAFGTGKRFVGLYAHEIDTRYPGPIAIMDAVHFTTPAGEVATFPPPTLEAVTGGALLVHNAALLSDAFLGELVEASAQSFRLILCYTDSSAETETVLRHLDPEIRRQLEERELVLPRFAHRTSVKREILQLLLEQATDVQGKQILGFSRDAWLELESVDFAANIAEAKARIERAVVVASGEVIEVDELFG